MTHRHPIGNDHPFVAVKSLAEDEEFDALEIVNVYDGTLIRLYTRSPDFVFRLKGDPGSAMDRQRFDYHAHVTLDPAHAADMLRDIKAHITGAGQPRAARSRGDQT